MGAVAVFDLDGTITRRDTYLAYLLGFLGRHPERWSRAAPLPFAVLYHLAGWRSNTWLKTTFLRAVLGAEGVSRHHAGFAHAGAQRGARMRSPHAAVLDAESAAAGARG